VVDLTSWTQEEVFAIPDCQPYAHLEFCKGFIIFNDLDSKLLSNVYPAIILTITMDKLILQFLVHPKCTSRYIALKQPSLALSINGPMLRDSPSLRLLLLQR
jgi:hypothetical protein